jgi:hypothetical protein
MNSPFSYKCESLVKSVVIFVVYPRYGCQSGHIAMPKLGGTTGIKPLVPVGMGGFSYFLYKKIAPYNIVSMRKM